jgi:hypothetical protein
LIPVLAGISYALEIPGSPITVSGDVFAGYSFARSVINAKYYSALTLTDEDTTMNFSGSGFAMDIGATVNYQINEPMSAGLTFGYRIANIASMSLDADTKFSDGTPQLTKGTIYDDSSNNAIPFDFSGFNIGVNVDMKY